MSAAKNMGTTAGQKTWRSDDGSVEIISTELLFCDATDLLADMTALVAPAGGAAQRGRIMVGDALALFARELMSGKLTSYLERLLKRTTLIARGDGAGTYDLKGKDALNNAFTGRQKYIFPAVTLALEVSFSGFLDGLGLIGFDPKALMAKISPSEDSSQSTSATG